MNIGPKAQAPQRDGLTYRSCLAAAAFLIVSAFCFVLSACSPLLGWGVLLWSVDEPAVVSGSVLPVYIKSNIGGVYVVGVNEAQSGKDKKIELPLWQLEFFESRAKAREYSENFRDYAVLYAETLQDALPIRSRPDNTEESNKVYKLRQGEIIKIMEQSDGAPAMTGGTPLPGNWYKVMTGDGTIGYCFSYRLRLFEQTDASIAVSASRNNDTEEKKDDPDLEMILSQTWYPDFYKTMIDQQRFDLSRYSENYGFFPGQESGLVTLVLPDLQFSFPYTSIQKIRDRFWRFNDTPVELNLRSSNVLLVQYSLDGGSQKSAAFVTLNRSASDFAQEERERRDILKKALFDCGPVLRSENYGLLVFTPEGGFSWNGYHLLVPAIVSPQALGAGGLELGIFLHKELQSQYTGVLSLRFEGAEEKPVNFLYNIEPKGLRLEYLPPSSIDASVAARRASNPSVIFFSRLER